MLSKAKLRGYCVTQKYDCTSFYRTSKTNKAAKRAASRRLRKYLDKLTKAETGNQ